MILTLLENTRPTDVWKLQIENVYKASIPSKHIALENRKRSLFLCVSSSSEQTLLREQFLKKKKKIESTKIILNSDLLQKGKHNLLIFNPKAIYIQEEEFPKFQDKKMWEVMHTGRSSVYKHFLLGVLSSCKILFFYCLVFKKNSKWLLERSRLWQVFSELAPTEPCMISFPSTPDLNGNLGQLRQFPESLL